MEEVSDMTRKNIEWAMWLNNEGGGGAAQFRLFLKTLIQTGATEAACGALDKENTASLLAFLKDEDAMNRIGRWVWWNEDPYTGKDRTDEAEAWTAESIRNKILARQAD
tara:strand:+ start:312 stop:638 length:327 start_codon:yes stop_codon:yes gene_type:complete